MSARAIVKHLSFRSGKSAGAADVEVIHNPGKKYEEVGFLGEGGYGIVIKAKKLTGTIIGDGLVAIKKVKVATDKKSKAHSLDSALREVDIHRILDSPYIVNFRESFVVDHAHGLFSSMFKTHKSDKELWTVMECCEGGDIANTMKHIGMPFTIRQIQIFTASVVLGLRYLHESKIVHRDIKGLNILLTRSGKVKICDFGTSEIKHDSGHGVLDSLITDFWMAPEMFFDNAKYGYEVDIWALGITMLEMINMDPPFYHLNGALVWGKISDLPNNSKSVQRMELGINEEPDDDDFDVEDADEETQMHEMIARCCETDPEKRPSAKDLLSDPFIREVVDDLISCEGHVCRFPGHETTDLAYIPKAQDGEDEDDIKCTCSQTHLELQLIAAIVLEKRM
mmetsp:Transcript_13735/g.15656  ORF Transcript_13735/g.15656 Transcript_13735/m.15656 type:complete len:395 (+) Transcript_13735:363-1547(+)